MGYPGDFPEDWAIAGWETPGGEWNNTEAGDRLPEGFELEDSDRIVVSYTDSDNVVHYWTIHDGVDDWDGLLDAIDDMGDRYGEA